MAEYKFRSLDAAMNAVMVRVNETLKDFIAEAIKGMEHDQVENVVYNAYDPTIYDRRGDSGGLSDVDNMQTVFSTNGKNKSRIGIVNTTPPNPLYNPDEDIYSEWDYHGKNFSKDIKFQAQTVTDLPGLVEFGQGYNGNYYTYKPRHKPALYMRPRPFVDSTRQELKKHARQLMIDGLRAQGLDVK